MVLGSRQIRGEMARGSLASDISANCDIFSIELLGTFRRIGQSNRQTLFSGSGFDCIDGLRIGQQT